MENNRGDSANVAANPGVPHTFHLLHASTISCLTNKMNQPTTSRETTTVGVLLPEEIKGIDASQKGRKNQMICVISGTTWCGGTFMYTRFYI